MNNKMNDLGMYIKSREMEAELLIRLASENEEVEAGAYHEGRLDALVHTSTIIDGVLAGEETILDKRAELRTIADLEVEVWDKIDGYEPDQAPMMFISIYNGDTSGECTSELITDMEAMSLTGKNLKELEGFTEWINAGELMKSNLSPRLADWTMSVISSYLDIPLNEMKLIYSIAYGIETLGEK